MIPSEIYFWFVTLCGVIYSGASQFVRGRLINMDRMKEIQKEMNRLNKEYFEAMKKQNNRRMDEIKAKQDKVMPEFSGIMAKQLKVMLVIVVIYMGFIWVLESADPYTSDDIVIELSGADGQWCGEIPLEGENGPWEVGVKAYDADGNQQSENGTLFFYGTEGSEFLPSTKVSGVPMDVFTDKESYSESEKATVCAVPPENSGRVVATANGGTWFHVNLPFEIPFFNTKTLNGISIWFILVAIVGGIGIGRLMQYNKKR